MNTVHEPGFLIPCPFCGSHGEIFTYKHDSYLVPVKLYWPSCSDKLCLAYICLDKNGDGPVAFETLDAAVELWNNRHKPFKEPDPAWLASLKHELLLAPMKSNFTLTRDELITLTGL
jgi:hypothetical protein